MFGRSRGTLLMTSGFRTFRVTGLAFCRQRKKVTAVTSFRCHTVKATGSTASMFTHEEKWLWRCWAEKISIRAADWLCVALIEGLLSLLPRRIIYDFHLSEYQGGPWQVRRLGDLAVARGPPRSLQERIRGPPPTSLANCKSVVAWKWSFAFAIRLIPTICVNYAVILPDIVEC